MGVPLNMPQCTYKNTRLMVCGQGMLPKMVKMIMLREGGLRLGAAMELS